MQIVCLVVSIEFYQMDSLFLDIQIIEKGFLAILEHFYAIALNEGKYIKNYRCLLWDKKEEMQVILNDLKITYKLIIY